MEAGMADLTEAVSERVALLTLNRPERLNAFSEPMISGLIEALKRIATNAEIGAVVLTGAGRAFCAGGDVKAMAERPWTSLEGRAAGIRIMHQSITLMRTIPQVVIAAVNGPCFGAGLGLVLAADLRFAAIGAQFGTSFARVGFSGDFGTSYHLTKLVGSARARELLLLGDTVDATRAEALGLVNRVVPDEALMDEAMGVARRLASGPTVAYGYMKRNLLAAEYAPLQDVLDLEAFHQSRTGMTDDHREASRAFVEKRPPVFQGR
jgi:2-(1,2-epoxy-1,2-dihydrophenyl)acetyl-CoA isomerase